MLAPPGGFSSCVLRSPFNLNPRSVAAVGLVGLALRFPLRLLLPVGGILVVAGMLLRPRRRVRPVRRPEIEPREAGVE